MAECIQAVSRERLSHKREKVYAAMPKVIMGNGGFCGCLIEPQGVSACLKETAQTRVFLLSRSVLLNHLELQSSKSNSYFTITAEIHARSLVNF